MKSSLSDLVTCPRCGPEWGLVLIPTRTAGRRVEEGVLGCPNCRERYRIAGGVASLEVPGEAPREGGDDQAEAAAADPEPAEEGAAAERAVRFAALLGLAEGGGTVVLAGVAATDAARIAALLPDVDVVEVVRDAPAGAAAGGGDGAADEPDGPGWSVLRVSSVLPLRSRGARAAALTGWASEWIEEGARVVGIGGRLVLEPAPQDAEARLTDAGLRILAKQGATVVAAR